MVDEYGQYYWCVKVVEGLAVEGEIYVHADEVSIEQGALVFTSNSFDRSQNVLVISPGQWLCYYSASVVDGAAVAVQHWKGEVER